jgi:hypothetical protein
VGGNLKVSTPARVYAGGTASVPLSWSGLATGKRYLGGVQLLDAAGAVASTTVLNIETDDPVPVAASVAKVSKPVGAK